MSATLSRRLRTLLSADAHGVIESLEERTLLLKQHLREAEIELDRKRARLEALGDERKRLADEHDRRGTERDRADADAALAIARGNDELARFALRKWLSLRDQAAALAEALQKRGDEHAGLAERVAAQEREFEALRRRVRSELALCDREGDLEGAAGEGWREPPVADEEVELELLRRRGDGGVV